MKACRCCCVGFSGSHCYTTLTMRCRGSLVVDYHLHLVFFFFLYKIENGDGFKAWPITVREKVAIPYKGRPSFRITF